MSSVHEDLAVQLGFRVDISHDKVFYGDNPRPATHEEKQLWGAAVQTKAAFKGSQKRNAELEADNASLRASCEAYREQLQKLHDFLKRIVPMNETSDSIHSAMQLISTAYNVPLEPRYPEDPMNSMLLDQLGIMQAKVAGKKVQQ